MGYVYILSNSDNHGILKIGKTDKDPEERAKQLSRQTGTIGIYQLEWHKEVLNSTMAEKFLHYFFRHFRIRNKKEHFLLSLPVATETAEKVVQKMIELDELVLESLDNEIAETIKLIEDTEMTKSVLDSKEELESMEELLLKSKKVLNNLREVKRTSY